MQSKTVKSRMEARIEVHQVHQRPMNLQLIIADRMQTQINNIIQPLSARVIPLEQYSNINKLKMKHLSTYQLQNKHRIQLPTIFIK